MTFDDACVALKAALVAGFTAYPLTYQNERPVGTFPPEPPSPWARVEYRNVIGEQRSIGAPGDNDFEREGAMVVLIFVPQTQGDQICRQIIEQIDALFRGKDIGPGVEILDIIGDDGGATVNARGDADESGAWWRRWTRIEFRYRLRA